MESLLLHFVIPLGQYHVHHHVLLGATFGWSVDGAYPMLLFPTPLAFEDRLQWVCRVHHSIFLCTLPIGLLRSDRSDRSSSPRFEVPSLYSQECDLPSHCYAEATGLVVCFRNLVQIEMVSSWEPLSGCLWVLVLPAPLCKWNSSQT